MYELKYKGEAVGFAGASEDEYSTEETVIGTWIDGKTLYRKVISFTTPTSSSAAYYETGIKDLDWVVSVRSSVKGPSIASNYYFYIPNYLSSAGNVTFGMNDNGKLQVICEPTGSQGKPAAAIIEYTKTTD